MKTGKNFSLFVILGAAVFGSACILEMPGATPQIIAGTATRDGAVLETPSPTQELTGLLEATFTPTLTATFTTAPVTMTAGQNLSCVNGPDWILYEWVAAIDKGETVTLTARAVPEIPDYYYVRKSDGTECWTFGGSSVINGSTANLPVRETPPLPTVTYVIQNQVMIPLCDVFIREAEETAWGTDRLTIPNIPINNSFSLNLTAGYYDVLIKDCLGTALYEAQDRPIGSDPNYRTQIIANDVTFSIKNNLPINLCGIEIQPPSGAWKYIFHSPADGGPFTIGTSKNFTVRAGSYGMRLTVCPAGTGSPIPLYIYPGMPELVLSE